MTLATFHNGVLNVEYAYSEADFAARAAGLQRDGDKWNVVRSYHS